MLRYLQHLSDTKAVNTIRGYITAISERHALVSDGEHRRRISDLEVVQTWMRGLTSLHPQPRVRVPSWDLEIVLSALKKPPFYPLKDASLKHLTIRTAFLMALTSARRASEVHAIRHDTLQWKADCVYAFPDEQFLPKVATQWHVNQPIAFPALRQRGNPELTKLCVRTTIDHYVKRTKVVRAGAGASSQLLICFGGNQKGHPVSVQRLSKWLKMAVEIAYDQANLPRPSVKGHHVRKQATSWADLAGVTPVDICRAATWKSSSMFARHYRLQLLHDADSDLGRRVIQLSASSSAERATQRRLRGRCPNQ